MQRLFFLLPNEASCEAAESMLVANGVDDDRVYIYDDLGDNLVSLPEAHVWRRNKLLPAFVKGGIMGAFAGFIAGFLIVIFPPGGENTHLGWNMIIGATVVGTLMGALMVGMISGGEHVERLDAFQEAVDKKGMLLVADVKNNRYRKIRTLLLTRHPARHLGTVDLGRT